MAPPDEPGFNRGIFISYGHADAVEFCDRLVAGLREAGVDPIYIDKEFIQGGDRWDIRIEHGIQACEIFAPVMTPGSLREESVCRDEVVYAYNQKKPLIPLRLVSNITPSLLLVRRSWIDFAENYDQGLRDLLAFLRGNAGVLREPAISSVAGLEPLDFGPEIAKHAFFSGRGWLLKRVDDWVTSGNTRSLIIVGASGIGKSAIAARLAARNDVGAAHFCSIENADSIRPSRFVASLVAQLAAKLPEFKEAVEPRLLNTGYVDARDAFRKLLIEPLNALRSIPPCLIVVDSLDEAMLISRIEVSRDGSVTDLLLTLSDKLPLWVRVVMTTRPEEAVMSRIDPRSVITLHDESDSAQLWSERDDVARYVQTRLQNTCHPTNVQSDAIPKIVDLAAGNFRYAQVALDWLETYPDDINDLDKIPAGLGGFYRKDFERRFDLNTYRLELAPLLAAFTVALWPLPFELLKRICQAESDDVNDRLHSLKGYLRPSNDPSLPGWSLDHWSVAEWLVDRDRAGRYAVDKNAGLKALGEACFRECLEAGPTACKYALRYGPKHLADRGDWTRLLLLLRDSRLNLFRRWNEHGAREIGIQCLSGLIEHFSEYPETKPLVPELAVQLGQLYSFGGQYDEARGCFEDLVLGKSNRQIGRRERALALHELGSLHLYNDEFKLAARHYWSAYRLSRFWIPQFKDEVAANLIARATVKYCQLQYKRAYRLAVDGLKWARVSKDFSHQVAGQRIAANACRQSLKFDEADERLTEAAAISCDHGLGIEKVRVRLAQARLMAVKAILEDEPFDDVVELLNLCLKEAQSNQNFFGVLDARLELGFAEIGRRNWSASMQRFQEVEAALPDGTHRELRGCLMAGVAIVRCFSESSCDVSEEYQRAIQFSDDCGMKIPALLATIGLGAYLHHHQDYDGADRCWKRAQRLASCSPLARETTKKRIAACIQDRTQPPML